MSRKQRVINLPAFQSFILLTEENVTPVILFLLPSATGGMTGQNIVADGGKVMQ